MHYQTSRKLARYSHIVIAIVQLAYIYTPIHKLPYAMMVVQIVTTPILVMSGIWITKGQKIWQWKNKVKKRIRRNLKYIRFIKKFRRTIKHV